MTGQLNKYFANDLLFPQQTEVVYLAEEVEQLTKEMQDRIDVLTTELTRLNNIFKHPTDHVTILDIAKIELILNHEETKK